MMGFWDRTLFGPRPIADPELLAAHQERAGELAAHLADAAASLDRAERHRHRRRLPLTDDATLVSLAVVLAERVSRDDDPLGDAHSRLAVLARSRSPLPFAAADVALLVDLADRTRPPSIRILEVAVAAADGIGFTEAANALPALGHALDLLDEATGQPAARLRSRLLALLPAGSPELADVGVVRANDLWSHDIQAVLADASTAPPVRGLLELLGSATTARPTRVWRNRCRDLLNASEGAGAELVRRLLASVVDSRPANRPWLVQPVVSSENANLLRGAAWAAVLTGEPWVPEVLGEVHRRIIDSIKRSWRQGDKLASACVGALGEVATGESVAVLAHLRHGSATATRRGTIDTALHDAARRMGTTRSALLEAHVPDGGLGPDGRRTLAVGDWSAVLAVDGARVTRRWRDPAGTFHGRLPAAVAAADRDAVERVRAARRQLVRVVDDERLRLEAILGEDRSWGIESWRRHYLDHPLTGPLSRPLVWSVERGPSRWTGIPGAEPDRFRRSDGEATIVSLDAVVRPWHPLFADHTEVTAWRELLLAAGATQPIEQVFRPIFRPAADEPATSAATYRFAGRMLDTARARRFLRDRGWTWGLRPTREFGDHGVRVTFDVDDPMAARSRIGAVRFSLPFAELAPIVFSEALYDIDRWAGA